MEVKSKIFVVDISDLDNSKFKLVLEVSVSPIDQYLPPITIKQDLKPLLEVVAKELEDYVRHKCPESPNDEGELLDLPELPVE